MGGMPPQSYPGAGVPPPPPGGGNVAMAMSKVSGPAIGLMVTAGIGLFCALLGVVIHLVGMGMSGMGAFGGGDQPNAFAQMMGGTFGLVINFIGIVMAAVIFMGASKMRKLESYGLAMAVSIIAMIPCISPCCLIGLPIGIWALVVLLDPNVKAAFRS